MPERVLLTPQEVGRTLDRLASEIIERHGACANLALVGIQRRGVDLADRLKGLLESRLGAVLLMGKLDINLYRDDWTNSGVAPFVNKTEIPFPIDGKDLLLVDDVLFTGRTIRAALEALLDFGRPRRVELLALVDRGNRELPIHADFVGKRVATERGEHVNVHTQERDGREDVCLLTV
ncbi:MAG: bifunctional pyr operon transcriptional regulator/uracil phosphoribosyltransferase PyrR [Thermodesulfobacteriota bacterium]